MKIYRLLIPFIIITTAMTVCSKDKNEGFDPDLTKNALFISDGEYLLSQGLVTCVWQKHPYEFMIQLFSAGLNHDTSENIYGTFMGMGDIITMEITTDTFAGPDPGTYSTDIEDGDPGFIEAEFILNFNAETFEASRVYELSSGSLMLQKAGSEYEFTIEGKCNEFDQLEDRDVVKEGINLALHYKGNLPEYHFPAADTSQ
jgi:hypothetical protein